MPVNHSGSVYQNLLNIYNYALESVSAAALIQSSVNISNHILKLKDINNDLFSCSLQKYKYVHILGAGKASSQMAAILEKILDNRIAGGVVITKYGHCCSLKHVKCFEAGHPVPDEASLAGTQKLITYLKNVSTNDLIIFAISGGASSLLVKPLPGISLFDIQDIYAQLVHSSASIAEINTARIALSEIKGGKLLSFSSADFMTIAISDVNDNIPWVIGYGPTVRHDYDSDQLMSIFSKINIKNAELKTIVINDKPLKNKCLKSINRLFKPFIILADNNTLLQNASQQAKKCGFRNISVFPGCNQTVCELADRICQIAIRNKDSFDKKCYIFGGETTIDVKKYGRGGRNQHLVLSVLKNMPANIEFTFLSAGTDGTDGSTEAAGAIADHTIFTKNFQIKQIIDDYLKEFNSYDFFTKYGGHIRTGPTGTNVNDIQILIV